MKKIAMSGEKTMQNAVLLGDLRDIHTLILLFQRSEIIFPLAVMSKDISGDHYYGIPVMKGQESNINGYEYIVYSPDYQIQAFQLAKDNDAGLLPAGHVRLLFEEMFQNESRMPALKNQLVTRDIILDSTHDGMIAIDENGSITLFNKSAEKMTGITKDEAIGLPILEVMPNSQLPRILRTKTEEINREQMLPNGTKIYTTRLPIVDNEGNTLGAFAVFKDITEIVDMAEEVTNLKSIQSMLHSIIQSSEEAISVVDEKGNGLMINPAYTRLTGYAADEVIGKPATIDITEGDSMHMQVLKTRKPVRGARLKVGPKKRDVVVNVAPILVDGQLKGSVGIIHDVSEIKSLTEELTRARQIIRTLEAKYSFEDIVWSSLEMEFAIEQAKLAASTPATVLLRGESGTGKELFAHAIHNASDRKYSKFIRVNCAAISESLLESELFGYVEGAFSGAVRGGKRGLFEEANGGSIFLDEIGELALTTQAKLLRVLQEKEIRRVGDTKSIPINVRVIGATNVNLEAKIAEGSFRQDLYYRLNRMPIFIPALRERKGDIPLLAAHLLQKLNQDYGRNVEALTDDAVLALKEYDWPGNVRELENVLGRAIIHMEHHEHLIDRVKLNVLKASVALDVDHNSVTIQPLNSQIEEFEKKVIIETLEQCGHNKTKAAKTLNVSLRNFYYKIEKYGINS
ncbi:sigma 54-interacting transcriptional regulator [Fictibacillus iocasae]|uniref:Sigma 54-interacting transcriptional regulator n=1 Tax=Fictibacillus iocasae TaxID=2715437 RepID=A0ABW2NJ64_9BACL